MIEAKRPPGIICVLDDVCATLHAVSDGADLDLQNKLNAAAGQNQHYQQCKEGFIIHHYAGIVSYNVEGFCDRNRDVLFPDLIELMQGSTNHLVRSLFPDQISSGSKSRPTTAGSKIRTQANKLVDELMKCTPHYIRYAVLTPQTWPKWCGPPETGIQIIMNSVHMDPDQYQLGKTKVFVKAPESLFLLEEMRERKYNHFARVIQKAFKKYFARKKNDRQKEEAADLFFGKKERRRFSLNRNFIGDYIGIEYRPTIQSLIGRREKIIFAEVSTMRDLVLTTNALFLIGREKIKKGVDKGKYVEVLKRKLEYANISFVSVSPLKDDFVIIHTKQDYDSVLEIVFKTEFLSSLNKMYKSKLNRDIVIKFSDHLEFRVKKEGWGGGGMKQIKFELGIGDQPTLKASGKVMNVTIGSGLPKDSRTSRIVQGWPFRSNSSIKRPGERNQLQRNVSEQNPNLRRQLPLPTRPAPRPPQAAPAAPTTAPPPVPAITPRASMRAPPPPKEPAPKNQPVVTPGAFRLPALSPANAMSYRMSNGTNAGQNSITLPQLKAAKRESQEFLMTPPAGVAGEKRASISGGTKPIPGGGKPKPIPRTKVTIPLCKAVYSYNAQDIDELSFKEGEIIEIVKEHGGGWWQCKLRGREGLIPANYVKKM
ncbi:hypothetical protein J437_LFUL011176 [Ladona fulva]|uniref:Uncharacterized protein n=1 Tax=Ladona fulva TaxID=123851 RepID=A0A8K0P2X7_LADFU|nr:hypothetical protein J437_LFUL011176 [Ladona fulva]